MTENLPDPRPIAPQGDPSAGRPGEDPNPGETLRSGGPDGHSPDRHDSDHPSPRLKILHADMDAFYANAEVLDDPSLAGLPLIIGYPGPRGVVSTASYEARKFGVHSAMPSTVARRLCPQAVWRPGRMKRYAELSRQIRSVFDRYTPRVEPLSLDEAFLDVAGCEGLFGDPITIAKSIRSEVQAVTGGLTISVGVAENKFLAKVASDIDKPDGLTVVPPGTAQTFLAPLPIERIWGVGKKTAARLHSLNVRTVAELVTLGEAYLVRTFGPNLGHHLWRLSHGRDGREVEIERDAKSVSQESTFGSDLYDSKRIEDVLFAAADRVAIQLRQQCLMARAVQLKARAGDYETWTRSRTLDTPTSLPGPLFRTAVELLETIPLAGRGLRLLGVGAKSLVPGDRAVQGDLFPDEDDLAQSKATALHDQIKNRFGPDSVSWGRRLDGKRPEGTEE